MFTVEVPTVGDALQRARGRPARFTVDGGRVAYRNDDTGVAFDVEVDGEGTATFTVPLLRPSYWGTELGEVVARFGGPEAVEPLVASWEQQNASAWALERPDPDVVVADEVVQGWWRWNAARIDLEPLYPGLHVPRAQIGRIDGEWRSFAVWTDLGPALLPPVDRLLVLSAGLVGAGVAPGLVPVTRQSAEAVVGAIPPDGSVVDDARDDARWLELLRSATALPDKVPAASPEDLVEGRYAAAT
jgi:hypothetical protein